MTAGELYADFRKSRSPRPVTCALRFPVDRAAVVVLFGPSGAGKTTVLRCIAGLEMPEEGTIRFGSEVWALGGRGVSPQARGIGYVAQDYALFSHLSAQDNIAYGLDHLASSERRRRTEEMIELLRLRGLEERRPRQLSGGEQQRVAVGRALIMRPAVLLADEPTGDLDEATADALHHLLREMHRDFGLTSIIATHNPRLAASCDRTLRLESGRLAPA